MSNVPEQLLEYLRGEESDGRGVFKAWADWVEAQTPRVETPLTKGLKDIKENIQRAFAIAAQTDNETPDDLAWARGVIARFHSLMDTLIAEATQPASPPQTPADSQVPPAPGEPRST